MYSDPVKAKWSHKHLAWLEMAYWRGALHWYRCKTMSCVCGLPCLNVLDVG